MKQLQGAALRSYLQRVQRENARAKDIAFKREKLAKMKRVYREHKHANNRKVKLQDAIATVASYAAIAKYSLAIAFHVVPIIILAVCAVKFLHWILL